MQEKFQEYELEAFYGSFYDDYRAEAEAMLEKYTWETIVHYMDPEIAEYIHQAIAPCDNKRFLLNYMMFHTTKYMEDFQIN